MKLEFGTPVIDGFRLAGGRPSEQKTVAVKTLGKVIVGKACTWSEWHVAMSGQVEVFTSDCFRRSLKSGRTVSFLLDHKPEMKLGDTRKRLELFSDSDGLWFKFLPAADDAGQNAVAAVLNGKLTQISVGYAVVEDFYFQGDDGVSVRGISEAILGEISLVRTDHAAVKSTTAIAIDGADFGPLEHEVKAGRFSAGVRSATDMVARIQSATTRAANRMRTV